MNLALKTTNFVASGEIQFEGMPRLTSFSAPNLQLLAGQLEFQVLDLDLDLRIFYGGFCCEIVISCCEMTIRTRNALF